MCYIFCFSILNGNVLGSKTLQVFFLGLKLSGEQLLCRLVATFKCVLLPLSGASLQIGNNNILIDCIITRHVQRKKCHYDDYYFSPSPSKKDVRFLLYRRGEYATRNCTKKVMRYGTVCICWINFNGVGRATSVIKRTAGTWKTITSLSCGNIYVHLCEGQH